MKKPKINTFIFLVAGAATLGGPIVGIAEGLIVSGVGAVVCIFTLMKPDRSEEDGGF